MRIIAGKWRGRTLCSPKGTATRPTTDRIRESMMSSVASLRGGFDGAVVLDAFSGSGALGFEALSRGGALAVLCEKDRKALEALQQNANMLDLGQNTAPAVFIRKGDVLSRLPSVRDFAFDLVFLDPPYALLAEEVFSFLDKLWESASLARDVLVVYEHAITTDIPRTISQTGVSWCSVQTKCYGDTGIDYMRRELP